MTQSRWILQILITYITIYGADANVNFTLFNGLDSFSDYAIECNTTVTIQCEAPANTVLIEWKINFTVVLSTGAAAKCLSSCVTFNNFSGRYVFTYDSTLKVSNLTINPVIAEDRGRRFVCDDGSFSPPFVPLLKVPPNKLSTIKNKTDKDGFIELSVKTACVYPASDVKFVWFTTAGNGVREYYSPSKQELLECTGQSNCLITNESKHIVSYLNITNVTGENTELRNFSVEIVYGEKKKFDVLVGLYAVKNTVTSSTTSSSINPPTLKPPFTIFPTSSPTKKSVNMINTNASENANSRTSDDTTVIIIASCSTAGGSISVILVACVIQKARQKRKNRYNYPS